MSGVTRVVNGGAATAGAARAAGAFPPPVPTAVSPARGQPHMPQKLHRSGTRTPHPRHPHCTNKNRVAQARPQREGSGGHRDPRLARLELRENPQHNRSIMNHHRPFIFLLACLTAALASPGLPAADARASIATRAVLAAARAASLHNFHVVLRGLEVREPRG